MVVVIEQSMGVPEKVVAFDNQHDPMPYIRQKLREWCDDVPYLDVVDELSEVEEAIALIEEEDIYSLVVHQVDEMNPDVEEE